jgi:integrase
MGVESTPMKHATARLRYAVKKHNTIYAALDIPEDVREAIGRGPRFFQSTKTGSESVAAPRVALLVAGWKQQIAKARGKMPGKGDTFWDRLRADYLGAKDADHEQAVQDLIERAVSKVADPAQASRLWKHATGQSTPLAPLVADWKASLELAPQTANQQHRDVLKMADHFTSLEAINPQAVKAWADKLIAEGVPATGIARIRTGARSLWLWLQDSGTIPVDSADPFLGPLRLARKTAKRNPTDRRAFAADEMARLYQKASEGGKLDRDMADLIAVVAFTGMRIEEAGALTVADCQGGVFTVRAAKTTAGVRQVPVHPQVAPLVARLIEASTDGFLIPSTASGQYGVRTQPFTKRFGRLKTSLGFGPGHVFHSIRKTVATQLEQAGVPEGVAADILGHDKKTMSYGLYSSGSSMQQKAGALAKVSYPGALDRP